MYPHSCVRKCRTCTVNVDHLVNELQLWSLHGLLNSKTMGIDLCTTTRKSTTIDELQLRIFRSFQQF